MVETSRTRGSAFRRNSSLVWALAGVGLLVGAFVLGTMQVLLSRARGERRAALRVVESSNAALLKLDVALENGSREFDGILKSRSSDPLGGTWVEDLRTAEELLEASLPESAGQSGNTNLSNTLDALVGLRAEL